MQCNFVFDGSFDAGNVSEPIRQQDHTIRVDPLDNFKKYSGGFNITNKHYWSVSVTASSCLSKSN